MSRVCLNDADGRACGCGVCSFWSDDGDTHFARERIFLNGFEEGLVILGRQL